MSAGRVDLHTHILPDGYRAALVRHELEAIAGAAVPEWSPRLRNARAPTPKLFPRLRVPQAS